MPRSLAKPALGAIMILRFYSRWRQQPRKVSTSLDALVKGDLRLAQQVERDDDVVDELFSKAKKELIQIIRSTQDSGEQAIDYLMIAKYFEKIGDHAVNISQWVLFMITGAHEEDTVHDLLRGGRS